jgi:5-dehydro-2-deoxygluconokinase
MFELLVPATPRQLKDVGADLRAYDQELRPALMVRAIRDLQDAGVEPDVWKVEGLDRRADYERIAAIAQRDGRHSVGCIVLGRAENEQHVRTWLATAAAVPGFIGFAVGRTTFWDPLIALRDEKISRADAVVEIARRYRQWVDVFEQSQATMRLADDSATGRDQQTS